MDVSALIVWVKRFLKGKWNEKGHLIDTFVNFSWETSPSSPMVMARAGVEKVEIMLQMLRMEIISIDPSRRN